VAKVSTGAPYAVVNTHHHPDHTFGNGFLPDETLVIGHDNCREMVVAAGLEATQVITAPDYGDLVLRPPEITFPERMTLHLSDQAVELLHVGVPAHTTNDVLVWLPERKVLFSGDLAFNGGQPFVLEGSVAGFRRAIAQMQELAPEVLAPGHGPVCRGDDVAALLSKMDDYLAFVEHVAAESHAAGLTPLEAAQKHRGNPYSTWAECERFVGNLTRAYAEIDAPDTWTRLSVPSVWPDMVTFHGGPIACHA
jgi:cyclase